MTYATIYPYTNELMLQFDFDAYPDIAKSQQALRQWRQKSVVERGEQLQQVSYLLKKNADTYARLITLEMGKPIREAQYEIAKTITAFDYYIAQAPALLADEPMTTPASKSYIAYEPLGIIFSIMPWNFPFWQVFRFAVPTLMAGNVTILKHAPNVPQCARAIQQLFEEAGIAPGVFCNYFLTNEDAARLIAEPAVAGISFTGSDTTGSYLASLAGKHIKKSVMELGGNDAFIVLEDANLEETVAAAIKSRSINTGQACNGAKRFIVQRGIAEAFTHKLTKAVLALKVGDPMDEATQAGPLARTDLADKVRQQINMTVQEGAQAFCNELPDHLSPNFVAPTVLTGVTPQMTAARQEIFGPVWSVMIADNLDEAVAMANDSDYGLAASIWTSQTQLAEQAARKLETGNVFINDIVKSDPRMPFGGVKRSGYGRELSEEGLKEFVNIKTVYIK
ncbi:MAG: NAD-dependent succinate-semialdehyde dehydrogenase [Bacteroidetes bacterium]|nr:NAD-dependent succinate-semialdehyde dehydrogenase [Bacteroidota bacterium]